jgi:hypothetical protein
LRKQAIEEVFQRRAMKLASSPPWKQIWPVMEP